ncbi:hypothetical protein [Paenibacillus sp. 32O-W]|uniref:hypothetical protein n=1 Tax=Paenibacillus sp. 32O-W TaxID=1695218 RepID=UPI00119CAB7E|nr:MULTISPECIES: hypothetical protein [Paenibacillaceae]
MLIGIKVRLNDSPVKALQFVRRYTALGLSEIKERLQSYKIILTLDIHDEEEKDKLLQFIRDANKLGLSLDFMEQTGEGEFEDISEDMLWNAMDRWEGISRNTETEMFLEKGPILTVRCNEWPETADTPSSDIITEARNTELKYDLSRVEDYLACRRLMEYLSASSIDAELRMDYADGDYPEEYRVQELLELFQEMRISEFLGVECPDDPER